MNILSSVKFGLIYLKIRLKKLISHKINNKNELKNTIHSLKYDNTLHGIIITILCIYTIIHV